MRFPIAAFAFLVCTASSAAVTYTIDVDKQIEEGLAVEVRTSSGPMAVITLTNRSKVSAICRADIEAGLQTPAVRRATIKAGAKATFTYTVRTDLQRMRVKLACKKPKAKEAKA
jgi:hypothetical protein